MNMAVTVNDLTRYFGSTCALDRLTMQIQPQTVLALLGPNGAGKTTLLRVLQGQIAPTGGEAQVLGVPAREHLNHAAWQIASMGEGQVPPGWATGDDLLRLQAEASPRFDRDYARSFLSSRGLDIGKPFSSLSKGQRRWLLAAVALASGAPLLLLDEPADGLDPAARRELFDAIRERCNTCGTTVIVATHVISDIERVADEAAILKAGRLLLHESLEDLRETVREIELPSTIPLPTVPNVTFLSCRCQADTQILWARVPVGDPDVLAVGFGPEARMRPVGLETLYLAVAESADPSGMLQETMR